MGNDKKLRVGITSGDINGIGIEVILKSLADPRVYEHCVPIIYASKHVVEFHANLLSMEDVHLNAIKDIENANPNKINVLDVWKDDLGMSIGQSTLEGGRYAFLSIQAAVEDIASNKLDVLVTAPINKKNIQSKEFNFPGHTEFLAHYANEENPLMILCHEGLRVALATGHIALEEVSDRLDPGLISQKLLVFSKSLSQDFGIHRPRIAVLGLNPHNGDEGLMGDEERTTIRPGIELAVNEGVLAMGPYPADGFFGSELRTRFDGILAMYHDQGLAPFKALAFDEGINFTAGLPIVRTAPDHGVAYDIAGKNLASERSFRAALLKACDIYRERQHYRSITADPLEVQAIKED